MRINRISRWRSSSESKISLLVTRYALLVTLTIAWCSASSLPAMAGDAPFFKGDVQSAKPEMGLPAAVKNVGIDQHLGEQVTLNLPMRDENGNAVTLGSYFGKRPVILVMAYYECPNLCTMVMNGVFGVIKTLDFVPGKDFEVVSVSFNPHDTPALAKAKKEGYLSGYHQTANADGFHFLTADEPAIEQLTKEVGFRYTYDTASKQYAHASGIMVLTPTGILSRYFMGVEFSPRDMKYGIMDASGGKIGSLADKLVLYCFHYDPATSKYGAAIARILRIGGILTLLAMGIMFYYFRRQSKRKGLIANNASEARLQIGNA